MKVNNNIDRKQHIFKEAVTDGFTVSVTWITGEEY